MSASGSSGGQFSAIAKDRSRTNDPRAGVQAFADVRDNDEVAGCGHRREPDNRQGFDPFRPGALLESKRNDR
jgi:hypothetical protein